MVSPPPTRVSIWAEEHMGQRAYGPVPWGIWSETCKSVPMFGNLSPLSLASRRVVPARLAGVCPARSHPLALSPSRAVVLSRLGSQFLVHWEKESFVSTTLLRQRYRHAKDRQWILQPQMRRESDPRTLLFGPYGDQILWSRSRRDNTFSGE